MSEDWTAGVFATNAKSANGDVRREAVGWVRHPFALDFRPIAQDEDDYPKPMEMQCAWVLTHIPTGWGIAAITAPLERAKQVADDFLVMGAWDFDRPEGKGHLDALVESYWLRNAAILTQPSITIPPWHRLTTEQAQAAEQVPA